MGGAGSKVHDSLSWKWHTRLGTKMRVVLVGLDASGKTTILYRLAFGDTVGTVPTVGFNVQTICFGRMSFITWDVGGQKKLRQLWQYYLKNTNAVIFVVDSSDSYRLQEAREALRELLHRPELDGGVLLVLANKQDQPNALPPGEIAKALKLKRMARRTHWHVESTIGTTGNGLYEGLAWMAEVLHNRSSAPRPRTRWKVRWESFLEDLANEGVDEEPLTVQ